MATNPDDIRLGPDERRLLAKLADESGKAWADILREALERYARLPEPSMQAWMKAQEDVLSKVWDNDEDAVYDAL